MEKKIPLCDENNDLINVVYSSINFKDVMIATGKLITDFTVQDVKSYASRMDKKCLIGVEFVGFNQNGQRIMGMCKYG